MTQVSVRSPVIDYQERWIPNYQKMGINEMIFILDI